MSGFFVVDESGVERGPYALEEVASLLASGAITHETLARPAAAAGSLRFKRLGSVLASVSRATGFALGDGAAGVAGASDAASGGPAGPVEWWYRDDADAERGPLSTAQLRSLVREGLLGPFRDVRRGRDTEYFDMSQWPELKEESELAARRGGKRPRRADVGADASRPDMGDEHSSAALALAAPAGKSWPPPDASWPDAPADAADNAVGATDDDDYSAADNADDYERGADADEGAELAPPAWEEEETEWVYIDDVGLLQGPFGTDTVCALLYY